MTLVTTLIAPLPETLVLLGWLSLLSLILLVLLLLVFGLWGPTIPGLMACLTTPVTHPTTRPEMMIVTLVTSWLLPCVRTLAVATSLALIDGRRLADAAVVVVVWPFLSLASTGGLVIITPLPLVIISGCSGSGCSSLSGRNTRG